eukprot:989849-Rhodomonas_salina.1
MEEASTDVAKTDTEAFVLAGEVNRHSHVTVAWVSKWFAVTRRVPVTPCNILLGWIEIVKYSKPRSTKRPFIEYQDPSLLISTVMFPVELVEREHRTNVEEIHFAATTALGSTDSIVGISTNRNAREIEQILEFGGSSSNLTSSWTGHNGERQT